VKGYAGHERNTLEAVVQARNAAVAAQGPAAQAQAENVLSCALPRLFALSEAYPDAACSVTSSPTSLLGASVRHQHRHGHRLENGPRGAAEDELAQARMAVSTHDDEIG
jgi:LemA family